MVLIWQKHWQNMMQNNIISIKKIRFIHSRSLRLLKKKKMTISLTFLKESIGLKQWNWRVSLMRITKKCHRRKCWTNRKKLLHSIIKNNLQANKRCINLNREVMLMLRLMYQREQFLKSEYLVREKWIKMLVRLKK